MTTPPNNLNAAALLRAAADGELSPAQQEALRAHLAASPGDQARIEFEQTLRTAVGRSMASGTAPSDLADRIRAAASAGPESDDAPLVETLAPATRDRSFWTTMGRRLSVAAALFLVVAGAWYAIGQLTQSPITERESINRFELARFLSAQHMQCGDAEVADRKFNYRSVDTLAMGCQKLLGQVPDFGQLFQGRATLLGMGKCAVPGPGSSVHMRFDIPTDSSGVVLGTASMFVSTLR